jgi:ABC-type uncharacterized transport system permease subunit
MRRPPARVLSGWSPQTHQSHELAILLRASTRVLVGYGNQLLDRRMEMSIPPVWSVAVSTPRIMAPERFYRRFSALYQQWESNRSDMSEWLFVEPDQHFCSYVEWQKNKNTVEETNLRMYMPQS